MIFPHPETFSDALDNRVVQSILPTSLRSAMLSKLPVQIRQRAMFSAGVQNVEFLQRASDSITKLLSGDSNSATQRVALHDLAESFNLKELLSSPRLNLILDTQLGMADGYGGWIEGQQDPILYAFPAQELYRAEERKEPRDWPERWEAAGGDFFQGDSDYPEGRMIALKNDDIWTEISAFGQPYAPFDYNSGMDLRDVDREEAIELGLIEPAEEEKPQNRSFNDGLEAHPGILDDALAAVLEVALGGLIRLGRDDVARFIGGS